MTRKIVILDSLTTTTDHAVWEPLRRFGEVVIYETSASSDVAPRLADAWAVLTNKAAITGADIAAAPQLRYIGVLATGYNIIDLEAAARAGVIVSNVPAYSSDSVAQMAFALLLELTNHVALHNESVRSGEWGRCESFTYRLRSLAELAGKTMGVVGYGGIGSRIGEIARAFGMNVATNSHRDDVPPYVERMDLDELLRCSDVLSLNTALTPERYHMIDARALSLMKPTALLINTARGGLVDSEALAAALREGRIAGAGLDVLEQEPPRDGSPLIGCPNCVITPHIAWQSNEAIARLLRISEENLEAFAAGAPRNVVS